MDGAYLLYSERQIEMKDFGAAIRTLREHEKWTPILLAMRQKAEEAIGGPLSRYEDRIPRNRRFRDPDFNDAELFYDAPSGVLVYLINSPSTILSGPGNFEARRQVERSLGPAAAEVATGVLVGAVGPNSDDLKFLTEVFTTDFESALRSSIDGRRARHLQFNWQALTGRVQKRTLPHIRDTDEEISIRFVSPSQIDDTTLSRVEILADPIVRIMLREIGESGFARHGDLLGRRGKRQEDFEYAISKAKEFGLVESEYLLQCKKTSAQLIRIKDIDQLSRSEISDFRCANCNRPFAEEMTSEGYKLSTVGRELVNGSHWMTIWITKRLFDLGVSSDAILWNVEESGEEVDLVLEHVDRLWIFELKDREFGAGDAYPFNYRKVRYKADEAVVITTEKVATDARRVFSEFEGLKKIHIVEGLAEFSEVIKKSFHQAGMTAAKNALAIPSAVSGFDLRKWYEARQNRESS
jgi:hypothetical protein